jgi:hypothetical protein
VDENPYITFKSTKIVRDGHNTYEVDGNFTTRGASDPEKLALKISGKGTGSGEIKGKMVFNRKNYGMNKGIPFITIADYVDVSFHVKGRHVSGPPLATNQLKPESPCAKEKAGKGGDSPLPASGRVAM